MRNPKCKPKTLSLYLAGEFKADVVAAALAVLVVRHQVPAQLPVREHHITEIERACAAAAAC